MARGPLKPYLFLAAGIILQGLSPVLTKLLLVDLNAASLVAVRYLIAVVVLLPFGWRPRREDNGLLPPRRRDWVALVLVGALGSGVATLLFTRSIELTSAGIATAISKTAPIFVALFAYLTLRERITSARLLLVGVMVFADILIGTGELRLGLVAGTRLWGDLLALGAGALRALAEVLGKASLRRFYPSTVALWRFGVGFAVTTVVALFAGELHDLVALDTRTWLLLIALGAVCTSLSMTLYYRGLRDIPAHVGVSLRLTGAIVTALVSWLVLGEALNGWHIAGIAVLVAGSYLIVVRTTRHAAAVTWAEPRYRAPRVTVTETLRGRVSLLVAGMVILTVMGSTILSIQHNSAVLTEQVRLTMVKTATIILQLRGVAQAPSPETYRQYLDRIIHHRIAGRFYSLEIMYLAVLDGQGNIVAWARSRDLLVPDRNGAPLLRNDNVAGLRLLQLADSGELAREQDLVPLSAELERDGEVIGIVKMGCKRSLAYRAASEIALRNLTLAVLLIALGLAASRHLVGQMARPLERLAAIVSRIARGELDAPLLPGGGLELESLGQAVATMAEELRTGQVMETALAGQVCAGPAGALPVAAGRVGLLAVLGAGEPEEQRRHLRLLLKAVAANEGEIAALAPGQVLCLWGAGGAEQDDVLRAAVTALEWLTATNAAEGAARGLLGAVESPAPAGELRQAWASVLAAAPATASRLLATAGLADALEAHLPVVPLEGSELYAVPLDEVETSPSAALTED